MKPHFAAVPVRALSDHRLTDRDVRTLAAVAAYDRMSSLRGQGQGAWASHSTMAAMIGADYSRFSVSINHLLELGYLTRERLKSDGRKFAYRVIYSEADRLPSSKGPLRPRSHTAGVDEALTSAEMVCEGVEPQQAMLCRADGPTRCDEKKNEAEYIPRSGGINSAEAGDGYSPEGASLCPVEYPSGNVGGRLAQLERSLKSGREIDRVAWYQWLGRTSEHEDDATRYRANRLAELVMDEMTAAEEAMVLG